MTTKHGFLDTLKHVAFEDEPEKTAKSPVSAAKSSAVLGAASVAAVPTYAPPSMAAQPIDTGTVADNNEIYRRLLSKTDFESTEAAATIHKFLDPLKAIADTVMPPNVKFKTAVVQAQAQAGLTDGDILSAFDKLAAQLQQEQEVFAQKAQQFAGREVSARQDRISQITNQIGQLQQELAQLSSELVDAQGKSARAQSEFAAAAKRREVEIEQQKAQYAALLKG